MTIPSGPNPGFKGDDEPELQPSFTVTPSIQSRIDEILDSHRRYLARQGGDKIEGLNDKKGLSQSNAADALLQLYKTLCLEVIGPDLDYPPRKHTTPNLDVIEIQVSATNKTNAEKRQRLAEQLGKHE